MHEDNYDSDGLGGLDDGWMMEKRKQNKKHKETENEEEIEIEGEKNSTIYPGGVGEAVVID